MKTQKRLLKMSKMFRNGFFIRRVICSLLFICTVGCGYGNIDYVKKNAAETLKQNNFEILGYQGYEVGSGIPFTTYGGAMVWYTIKSTNDDKIILQCGLKRWGKEIHIYSLTAINVTAQNKSSE